MSEIAHEFESLLGAVRTRRVVVDNDVLDTGESVAIALFESLHLASSGVIEPSRRALFERIQVLAQGNSAKAGPDIGSVLDDLPFEIWQSLTGDEKHRLEQAVEEGDDLYVITTSFDIASFDEEFSSLREKLAARGEVIATSPMVDVERSDKINFQILFAGRPNLVVADPDLISFPGLGIRKVASKPETPASGDKAEANSLVCLLVTDNGRGVDPELVSQAAIKLGVIGKDTLLDLDHSVRMIFRPGFTTLSSASTISGRGVGLDVVETAVEHVGGELRASSELGRGSTFAIRLPATFGLLGRLRSPREVTASA